jgi:hypothetical protein
MTVAQTIRLLYAIAASVCFVTFPSVAFAQAFLPPAGEGNLTVSYQNLFARGHWDLNGDRMSGDSGYDPTQGHAVVMEVEFGLTNRLAVSASLPYIRSRYEGTHPHLVAGVPGELQEWDNGLYHGTFQDFRIGARYNVTRRPFAITPSFEVIIPSHHYPATAHAAVGKDLRAYVVGGSVGGFLDALLPRMFFQTTVSYAVVQDIVGIRPNRSLVAGELGYFIKPRLSVRFLESYLVTHDGFDLLSFTPMTDALFHGTDIHIPPEYRRYHDRLQASNYFSLGGAVGFSLNDSIEVFADAAQMVWGESVHPLRGISVGINTHFSTRRAAPGPRTRDQERTRNQGPRPRDYGRGQAETKLL